MAQHSESTDSETDTNADSANPAARSDPAVPPSVQAVEPRFWISTVSLDDVGVGVIGGFVQADQSSPTRLRWLRRGDSIVMYSPRVGIRAGAAVQAFTALGFVADDEPFQVRLGPDVEPWRRRVQWQPCSCAEVRPLLELLAFVIDKKQWGYPFMRGLFRIDGADFKRIASAMATDWSADGGRISAASA